MIRTGATLDGYRTLTDGLLKISFAVDTTLPEWTAECSAALIGDIKQGGWLIFSPTKNVQVPKEPPKDLNETKTQSQRLRAVLFRNWENEGAQVNFELYYHTEMEAIIEQRKAKLPPQY